MSQFIYILLGIWIVGVELRRYRRGQPLDAMTAFNVAYFILFVFVPINVLYFGEDVVRQKYAYETYGAGGTSTAVYLLASYVLFCLGYSLKSRKTVQPNIPVRKFHFSLQDSVRVAKIALFMGIALMAIYTAQLGGVSNAIAEAGAIRYGEITLEGKFVFYTFFCQFASDAFVLFFAILVAKRARKIGIKTKEKVFLLSAFLFFVYYGLTTGGRRPFIYPILLCFLVYWSVGRKMKKAGVAVLALVFIIAGLGSILGPIILSGNLSTAFDIVNVNRADWPALFEIAYDNATAGVADSYIHFAAAQKATLWQFGFLTDIVNLPRDFFPSRLFGFSRTRNFLGDTSEFILGHPLEEGTTGEEPLGLHGYLLVNFGYAGMLTLFFCLGMFYRWIHIRFKPTDPKDAVGWLIYWWLVLGFFIYLRDGLLIFVLKEQITWWILTALLLHHRVRRIAMPAQPGGSTKIRPANGFQNLQTST